MLMVISPMGLWVLSYAYFGWWVGDEGWAGKVLERVAFGWNVLGAWGVGVGVWGVWWPGWLGAAILSMTKPPMGRGEEDVGGYKDDKGQLVAKEAVSEKESFSRI